jgi:hypothetical protein
MKLSFLKYKTESFLKRNKSLRANIPYKQTRTVGIIFTVEDKAKHSDIKDLIKRLEQDGKKVTVISYLPKDKANYEFLFDFFTDKDLSFWGNITSSVASRFADEPFDILYYLDTDPNPLILNLIAKSKAHLRVGKYWQNSQPFFELMIESEQGTKSLIEQMLKYTRALK